MPSCHVIIGADLLLVHAPAGGRPGSASVGVQWWLAAEDV